MYYRKTRKTEPPRRFKKGRVCKKYGCGQRLSVYNSELYCHVHLALYLR
jgi:hypothetical protein